MHRFFSSSLLASFRARALIVLICAVSTIFVSNAAHAQSVTARIASLQTYVDSSVRIVIDVADAETFDGPFAPTVDGLEFTRLANEQTSNSFQIINGRATQKRSVAVSYEVTPRRVGAFEIPPFAIDINGTRLLTRSFSITAVISETGDLMTARVVGLPRTLYVGQKGALVLEVAVRRYRDKELGVTLDEGDMWNLLDNASTFGVFAPALARIASENRRPRGESRIIDGTEYVVYSITKPFDPIAAGTPQVGDIRVRMDYPTKLRRGTDFFDRGIQLASARPISASPTSIDIDVLTPPEGGQPASWNGAVGRFAIAVAAKPVDVAVGDPITLTLRLTDTSATAALEGVQAPALAEQASFTDGFRIPPEAAAGVVDGTSKTFTQSLRANNDAVREIPSVEFSYFDPTTGAYESVRSAPIAITVKPSATVRLTDQLPATTGADAAAFTTVQEGLLADASLDECLRDEQNSGKFTAFLALAPCVVLLTAWLIGVRADRAHRDPRGQRRRAAHARFTQAMAKSPDPHAIETALLTYIADRSGAREGAMTRKDARTALTNAQIDAPLIEQIDALLRACELARYRGGSVTLASASEFVAQLERASWTHVDHDTTHDGETHS